MSLEHLFISKHGCYAHIHLDHPERSLGTFCWSGKQLLQVMRDWGCNPGELFGVLAQLTSSGIPRENSRPAILIEGQISCVLAKHFSELRMLETVCPRHRPHELTVLPSGQILYWFAYTGNRNPDAVGICFTDPRGKPALVIVRSQVHGLMALGHHWIDPHQKDVVQKDLARLQTFGDDLDFPTLIEGDLIKLFVEGCIHFQEHFPDGPAEVD